jgi:hypothetical protein
MKKEKLKWKVLFDWDHLIDRYTHGIKVKQPD